MAIKLTIGFGSNARVEPLRDGTVKPDSIELEFVPSRNLFYHNLAIDDLDCSEMSISETILAKERGNGSKWNWSVVPIFMSRAHGWNDICVNVDSGIETLEDLKGKRVAVPDYDMTAALWLRCLLKDLYGIEASDIDWYNIRPRGESHGMELGLDKQTPVGVNVTWHPEGMDAAGALERGEVDAVRGLPAGRAAGHPKIRKLLPDNGKAVISEHFQKTGFHHTNHHVIVQERIVQEHPWVPLELYRAFQRSKEVAYQRARQRENPYLYFQETEYQEQAAVFGDDPYPFGIKNMGPMLTRLYQGSLEQGLITKPITPDDIYHPSTLDT